MIEDLHRAAKALMDSVNFDMVGQDGRGGNGGLISTDTMRRSDELHQVIIKHEAEEAGECPACGGSGKEARHQICRDCDDV